MKTPYQFNSTYGWLGEPKGALWRGRGVMTPSPVILGEAVKYSSYSGKTRRDRKAKRRKTWKANKALKRGKA